MKTITPHHYERIYLAGPMRHIEYFNFPAFAEAAKRLRELGFKVWSPAESDIVNDDFDPTKDQPRSMSHYMSRDLPEVCQADAIAVLPGWETSEGAQIEVHVARALCKPIVDVKTLEMLSPDNSPDKVSGEVRITDPNTGGQKGEKLAAFNLLPVEPMEEVACVYGRGAKKYSPDNWRRGYKWSLSYAALIRHAMAFWRGESRDELGNHHLACVVWHCLTMMWFEKHRPELDDRADKPT